MRKIINTKVFYFFIIVSACLLQIVFAQAPRRVPEKKPEFVWYRYDDGLRKAQAENKNIMINFYTKWCGYCRKMDNGTFADEEVKKVLMERFVPVKVDGGSKNKISFNGKKITEKELTTRYRVSAFPSTMFLNPAGEKIQWMYNPVRGYVGADIFLEVLKYLKDDLYKKMSFKDYLDGKKEDNKVKKD